jgi:Zn-dependent protease with chaperone function
VSIANSSTNAEIIEWDSENDVLDIRDPYLLFYLRWSEFEADRIGPI